MSTGYSWEGIRQVGATLLVVHVMYLSAFVVAMCTWGDISSVRRLTEAVISLTTIQYDTKESFVDSVKS